jgi:hypothetical protein
MKHGFVKTIALALLVLSGFRCLADDTNIIVATAWSEPVSADSYYPVRGRLVITGGSEPAYGGPKAETANHTMLFVELQNAYGADGGSIKLFFNVMGLKCELVDANGKPAPKPRPMGWSGRGAFAPSWIVLPYNSTVRLFVNSGSKSPLRITETGEPWSYWEIPSSDTNEYYLSGTLTIQTATNAMLVAKPHNIQDPHEYHEWNGTLVFPKVKISADTFAKQN